MERAMSLYLSRLILHANHPQAVSERDHPYELHRTICRAFENPDEARILFRADTDRPGEVHVLVQSLVPPDWERLKAEPKYLKGKDDPKPVELAGLKVGMPLRFRLRCRPSKRIGEPGNEEQGKRKSLRDKDEIFAWLKRKAEEHGFEVKDVAFDRIYWHESKGGKDAKPLAPSNSTASSSSPTPTNSVMPCAKDRATKGLRVRSAQPRAPEGVRCPQTFTSSRNSATGSAICTPSTA
ncbi:MAG: CRISPR-associated endoribonuclease Cse3 [Armatimonadetes bacterium OLB18]|nr:MAG: CRISPR-associated endoribonuclease Cse3 [Armatimonadetes bacterium OLB18]